MDASIVIGVLLVGYLLGSIPTAVWLSKAYYHTDIRNHGSGNSGSTNTYRTLGFKAGAIVQVVDILKGLAATLLANAVFIEGSYLHPDAVLQWKFATGMAAVLGHIYPVFAGFRGGKGMNTLLGIMLGINLWASLTAVIVFVIVLLIWKYVSLSSILAVVSFPAYLAAAIYLHSIRFYHSLFLLSFVVPFVVVYTHRENIQRLLARNERKVHLWRPRRTE